jgi:hypothetical protein
VAGDEPRTLPDPSANSSFTIGGKIEAVIVAIVR